MIVDGSTRLAAAPDAVVAVLRDPARLAAALPNVDDFAGDGDHAFTATIRPAIALGDVPFRTAWTIVEPAERAITFAIEGRGDEHRLEMTLRIDIAADGDGSRVTWVVDYGVSGTMRAVGQRVVDAIVAAQARIALRAVGEQALGGGTRAPA